MEKLHYFITSFASLKHIKEGDRYSRLEMEGGGDTNNTSLVRQGKFIVKIKIRQIILNTVLFNHLIYGIISAGSTIYTPPPNSTSDMIAVCLFVTNMPIQYNTLQCASIILPSSFTPQCTEMLKRVGQLEGWWAEPEILIGALADQKCCFIGQDFFFFLIQILDPDQALIIKIPF